MCVCVCVFGYKQELQFTPPKVNSKHRSRNIIWFNPPYNECISSKIGRDFPNLISKHFPNNSPQTKIFNKKKHQDQLQLHKQHGTNNEKKHNKNIASTNSTSQPYNQCNCRVKSTCPLPNKCLYTNTIYKSTVKTNNSVKQYISATRAPQNKESSTIIFLLNIQTTHPTPPYPRTYGN